jgi:glycosyltransferase involved in cell wall biosynthesis
MCANGQLLRDGGPCELCVGRVPWRGVMYGCYRDSVAATIPIAVAIQVHRSRNTWTNGVTRFVAVTDFVRRQFVAGGLPADRIRVKPNFVPRPLWRRERAGDYFLFLGRLSPDKGVDVLLDAWTPTMGQLVIVGDGECRAELEAHAIRHGDSVRFLGRQPREQCMKLLTNARALVVASRWYETFGLVVVEAYAHGVPVVAPALGVFPDLVEEGQTGLLFSPGDANDLRRKLYQIVDPELSVRMGERAYQCYEAEYTPERNLAALMAIYHDALAQSAATR